MSHNKSLAVVFMVLVFILILTLLDNYHRFMVILYPVSFGVAVGAGVLLSNHLRARYRRKLENDLRDE